ncbi:hypothetical protein [Paenibacillus sonchi]|jgi:hypothetical protein|nr:hypothetical protein [Paenibacillus sonchi]
MKASTGMPDGAEGAVGVKTAAYRIFVAFLFHGKGIIIDWNQI